MIEWDSYTRLSVQYKSVSGEVSPIETMHGIRILDRLWGLRNYRIEALVLNDGLLNVAFIVGAAEVRRFIETEGHYKSKRNGL